MNLKETILKFADDMQENMISCRRDLHAHPEPGWTEFRTAAKVAKTLAELGYTVKTGADTIRQDAMMGVPSAEKLAKEQQRAIAEGADPDWVKKMDGGRTGVLGIMKFSEDGPVVAVRFDMDSNDVTETGEASHRANKEGFASCHAGAMHACGHDGHTTVGLALARLLASLKDQLRGTIKLCFQPAEEGVRGAHAMVESGIVDDVDYMLGAHFGFKMRKTGTVACNVTGFLATSKYDARFQGVPAHAALRRSRARTHCWPLPVPRSTCMPSRAIRQGLRASMSAVSMRVAAAMSSATRHCSALRRAARRAKSMPLWRRKPSASSRPRP